MPTPQSRRGRKYTRLHALLKVRLPLYFAKHRKMVFCTIGHPILSGKRYVVFKNIIQTQDGRELLQVYSVSAPSQLVCQLDLADWHQRKAWHPVDSSEPFGIWGTLMEYSLKNIGCQVSYLLHIYDTSLLRTHLLNEPSLLTEIHSFFNYLW